MLKLSDIIQFGTLIDNMIVHEKSQWIYVVDISSCIKNKFLVFINCDFLHAILLDAHCIDFVVFLQILGVLMACKLAKDFMSAYQSLDKKVNCLP